MFVAPLVAAVALTRRERHTGGVADLLRRVADHGRIPGWGWYVPIVVLAPAVMVLSYAVLVLAGRPLPAPDIALASVPVLVLVYGVAAACEELGWMGYAGDALWRAGARWSPPSRSVRHGRCGTSSPGCRPATGGAGSPGRRHTRSPCGS